MWIKSIISRMGGSKGRCFVALSGVGWCLDFALFYIGVDWLEMPSAWANIISATTAAMSVFLASRWWVFKASGTGLRSIFVYFLYTESNIVVWALAISWITSSIHDIASLSLTNSALLAKVIVTPLSLACNFVVSRWLSRDRSYE